MWLHDATAQLKSTGISTARLDSLILLEHVTGVDRAKLLVEVDMVLKPSQITRLNNLLKRRISHEPLAYILGQVEFYGRTFVVDEHVLVPRPESETMIDELKNIPKLGTQPIIADVGTGSGALGITAKLELPNALVELIDIDPNALKVAKSNVDKFTLPIKVLESDLLGASLADYDILLCNLPYVPDDFQINTAATREPRLAIYGGPDGLDIYRKLFKQLAKKRKRPLYFLSEAMPPQHHDLKALALSVGYKMVIKNDFIQVFKRIQK